MPTYAVVSKAGEERHSYSLADAKKHQPFQVIVRHNCTCRGFGEFPESRHEKSCPAMSVTIRYGNGQTQEVPHYAVSVVKHTPVFAGSHVMDERRGERRASFILFAIAAALLLRALSGKAEPDVAVVFLVLAVMAAGGALVVLWHKGIRISVGSPPRR